jgi:hypothetical protein
MPTNITANPLTNLRTRVVGSSYTVWTALGNPIVWCVDIDHESPRAVAEAVPIQPLNYIRPAEILVPRAVSYGKITMNVIETYGNKPWEYLNGFFPKNSYTGPGGLNDLADVLNYMADQLTDNNAQSQIKLYRIIRTPGNAGATQDWYLTEFDGVRIVDIRENEKANTNAMQNNLQIEAWYTRKIDSSITPSGASTYTGVSGGVVPTGGIADTAGGGVGYLGD